MGARTSWLSRSLPPTLLGVAIILALVTVAVPVIVAEGALHMANRPTANPAAADRLASECNATWQAVAIQASDGTVLKAWYFTPADALGAAVLLLHGVGDTRLGVMGQAQLLLREGYATLLPDARGHGASGGSIVSYGLREARDAAEWERWMAARPGVRRTYGLGESMGASVLIESLALRPGFRAIVAECAFARFSEIARYRVAQQAPAELQFAAGPVTLLASWYTRARYGINLMQVAPVDAIRGSRTPVLLIHGTLDTNIPAQQSVELHSADPVYSELWLVDGARHVEAMSVEPQEYRRRVRDWLIWWR